MVRAYLRAVLALYDQLVTVFLMYDVPTELCLWCPAQDMAEPGGLMGRTKSSDPVFFPSREWLGKLAPMAQEEALRRNNIDTYAGSPRGASWGDCTTA